MEVKVINIQKRLAGQAKVAIKLKEIKLRYGVIFANKSKTGVVQLE